MRRAISSLAAAVLAVACTVGPVAAPASASTPEGIVTGQALAAAGAGILNVNPNFDVWPAYTLSEISNDSSHGLTGALYPGFLIDAFFFLYGAQTTERSTLAIAETAYPPGIPSAENPSFTPTDDERGISDGAWRSYVTTGCANLMAAPQVLLRALNPPNLAALCGPAEPVTAKPPASLGAAESHSHPLRSNGRATMARMTLPGLVSVESSVSTSDTRWLDGATVSEATQTLTDVNVAGVLRIGTVVARSWAKASGAAGGADARGEIVFSDVTVNGQPTTLGADEAQTAGNAEDLNRQLAPYGLEVRVVRGGGARDPRGTKAEAVSGGLVVRLIGYANQAPLPGYEGYYATVDAGRQALCRTVRANQPPEIYHVDQKIQNPLFGNVPFVPMDREYPVNASVPPPVDVCPEAARGADLGFLLGATQASAGYQPEAATNVFGFDLDLGLDGAFGDVVFNPGQMLTIPFGLGETLVALPLDSGDAISPPVAHTVLRTVDPLAGVAGRVRTLYLLLAATLAAAVGLPFWLRGALDN